MLDEVTGAADLKLPWERQVLEQMPVLEVKGLNTEWPECFVPAQRTKTRRREQPARWDGTRLGCRWPLHRKRHLKKSNQRTEKLPKRNRQPKHYRQQN